MSEQTPDFPSVEPETYVPAVEPKAYADEPVPDAGLNGCADY